MFKSITIKNIGPIDYLELSELDTSTSPILILGPNRVGKSTLLDSLAFVICGEFPSKGGSHYNRVKWGAKSGSVEAEVIVGNKEYKLIREIDVSNKKTKARVYYGGQMVAGPSVKEVDKFIEENIVDKNLFLMTNFSSQFHKGDFLVMDAAERKRILSDMLGFRFNELFTQFSSLKKTCDNRCVELQSIINAIKPDTDITEFKSELNNINKTLKKYNTDLKNIDSDLDKMYTDRESLYTEIEQYNNKLRRYTEVFKSIERIEGLCRDYDIDPDNFTTFIDLKREELSKSEEDKKQFAKTIYYLQDKKQQNKFDVKNYNDTKSRLEKEVAILDGVPCGGKGEFSGCQFLSNAHKAKEKLDALVPVESIDVEEETSKASVDLANTEAKITDLQKLLSVLSTVNLSELSDYKDELESLKPEISQEIRDKLDVQKETIQDQVNKLSTQQKQLNIQISTLMLSKGKIETEIASYEKSVEKSQKAEEELKSLSEDQKAYEAIVAGFGVKGVQPLLLELALPEICDIANMLLEPISDGDLFLALQTIKEVNNGTETRETLSVEVNCSDGRVGDVLEFSGAEQNMVRTALRCALTVFNLRNNRGLNLLAADEIFGAYDAVNNERVMRMLVELSKMIPQVILISHQQETFGLAGSIINLSPGYSGVDISVV